MRLESGEFEVIRIKRKITHAWRCVHPVFIGVIVLRKRPNGLRMVPPMNHAEVGLDPSAWLILFNRLTCSLAQASVVKILKSTVRE